MSSLCFHSEWFRRDSSELSGNHHITKSWSFHHPSLLPPSLSAQTDEYLFPRWGLLTARLVAWKESHRSLLQNQTVLRSHWGKKLHSRYHSRSSVSTSRPSQGPSSIRGGAMTLLPCNQQRDSLIYFHKPHLISRHKAHLTNQICLETGCEKMVAFSLLKIMCNIFQLLIKSTFIFQ